MADPKKKTFTDFVQQGPDPVDDAKVTEFAQRSQDPRAAPWEALRRGGARLDSVLGTGPASRRSRASELVENFGHYLNPPVPGRPYPGPGVGPTRDVGHFESLAQKLPDALTGPTLQAMAFPTGEESLARMREEAVLRDALESSGARELRSFGETEKGEASKLSNQDMADIFWNQRRASEIPTAEAGINAAKESNANNAAESHLYGQESDFRSVNTGSDPTLGPLRHFDINATGPITEAPPEAAIPAPSTNPERPTLEAFLSRLLGPH